jgi:undecaprenyl-diphosphatase
MPFTIDAILDLGKLGLIVAGVYAAFALYVQHRKPGWSVAFQRRRLALLWAALVVASGVKVTEDVLGGDSGPVDRALLLFIRDVVPAALNPFFELVTLTGSATALVPLALLAVTLLLLRKHRFEAFLVAASTVGGASVVYVVKMLVGRERPMLWKTEWYWGSSFPSGHTLVVAAFATALALGIARLRPARRDAIVSAAFAWILLVALSRLVLGVHWPTDVLAAACIGAALPLAISLGVEFWRAR